MELKKSSIAALIIAVSATNLLIGILIGTYFVSTYIGRFEAELREFRNIKGDLEKIRCEINSTSRAINNIYSRLMDLNNSLSSLESKLAGLSNVSTSMEKIYSEIYYSVRDSIVLIRCVVREETFFGVEFMEKQGSGFIYNCSGRMVVLTNYHVVSNAYSVTVTFSDGESYPANVIGYDPYIDLAVLSVDAPLDKFRPLEIVSSSTLRIGDIVVVIGNPFGLTTSFRHGIVSQLGRTIPGEMTGGFPLADVIQISVPINPGDSGSPLLNLDGKVVGIATAIISGAQGVGFAVSSDLILKEVDYLVEHGYYDLHSWIGVAGIDMNYDIARAMNINVTYGWLIVRVFENSPAAEAGLRGGDKEVTINGKKYVIGGDVIIAINDTKIICGDNLASYLEKYTLPGQTVKLTIIREGRIMDVYVKLGKRPKP